MFTCGPAFFAGGTAATGAPSALLLHFDGSDASTSFVDYHGHTFTAHGNAQIDTAQSKFGGSSGLFDGSGDWIDTPDSADFTLGTADFTIEFWVRFNSATGPQYICGQGTTPVASNTSFVIYMGNSGEAAAYCIDASGGAVMGSTGSATNMGANQWYHMAYVRHGTQFTMYLDGVGAVGGTPTSSAVADSPDTLSIGRCGTWGLGYFNGWIEEFRFTQGTALYTANFTPPTAAFPDY